MSSIELSTATHPTAKIRWRYVLQPFSPIALMLFAGLCCVLFGAAVSVFRLVNTLGFPISSPGTALLAVAQARTSLHFRVSALILDIQEGNR